MKPVPISAQISILDGMLAKGTHGLRRGGFANTASQAEFLLERLTAVRETLRQIEPLADDMRELVRKRLKAKAEAEAAKRNIPQKVD